MNAQPNDALAGSACRSVVEMWDAAVADFLAGGPAVPSPLQPWHSSYSGAVDLEAFPEPFLGSLVQPKAVFLALNPGPVDLCFQRRDGIFADEIRKDGSYSVWAASWPYLRDPWVEKKKKKNHHSARLQFMRNWFGDSQLTGSVMVGFELYPWHSTGVTSLMRPPASIIEEFVWRPVAELGAPVFAFGAPWFSVLEKDLGLEVVVQLRAGEPAYPSTVPSRRVSLLQSKEGVTVIAEKHSGSACPPSRKETLLLKEALAHWL